MTLKYFKGAMYKSLLVLLGLPIMFFVQGARAGSDSLDLRFHEIKEYGSLTGFCNANPSVLECMFGIGDWKPEALERIKSASMQCFDICPADTYGFVRSPHGKRDYPEVNTKDFDGSAPSRGVEFRLYPLSFQILMYEGCAGCSLVKQTPKDVYLSYQGKIIRLPMLGYGIFYVPRPARKLLLHAANANQPVNIKLGFVKKSEDKVLSSAAVGEYARMIKELNYSEIK